MIVICTKCQAKFRVADEKIGPRGAKVRCSRCQTVFAVQREAASAEAAASPQPVAAPAPSPSALPVTDLSDLLGPATRVAVPRPIPPPLPPPLPSLGGGPAVALETPLPFDLAAPDPMEAPQDGGLALEDRLTPRPMKVPPASVDDASLEVAEPAFNDMPGFDAAPSFDPAPDPSRDPFAASEPYVRDVFDHAPAPGAASAGLRDAASEPAWAARPPPRPAAAPDAPRAAPLAPASAPAAPA